jgi:NAD(P)-dependent dehydrogenase (short-subunit alcohol dehydrogenase family)
VQIDLSGHRALVTGSTAGIGYAIADALVECGATVIVNGRDTARVDEAVGWLRDKHPQAEILGVVADIGTAEGVRTIIDSSGDVDVMVLNAAIYGTAEFADIPDEEWQQYYDVNVMSAVRLCRHYAPRMAEANWGRIVMIASEAAVHIHPQMVHYGVSKIALLALARGVAASYPGTGLTVNAVLPGPTRSRGVTEFLTAEAARLQVTMPEIEARWIRKWRPTSVSRRVIEAEEVANAVAYLCSPLSAATTGATLRADGGVVPTVP